MTDETDSGIVLGKSSQMAIQLTKKTKYAAGKITT